MLMTDFHRALDRLAAEFLAEPWDNAGLQIASGSQTVRRVLVALELTEPVVAEAISGGYDTVLTHHPLFFTPLRSLGRLGLRETMIRRLVRGDIRLFACHTSLDAASGGLADEAARALDLKNLGPIRRASAGWYKFVGFIPPEHSERVAAAVFEAGAGGIGNYRECAFRGGGEGWFTPLAGADPAIGSVGHAERTPEHRWETVVPRPALDRVITAYVNAHPYEEPAFDVYPVEDVLPKVGLGRVGTLSDELSVRELAILAARTFQLSRIKLSGDERRVVRRVGILPGSGSGLIEDAAAKCEVLITGDLGYHDAERAGDKGLALIGFDHGEMEWWALSRWVEGLRMAIEDDKGADVTVALSARWKPAWTTVPLDTLTRENVPDSVHQTPATASGGVIEIWIDGGSRGNPGPAAIGVVAKSVQGVCLRSFGRTIGRTTNNVAEYRALLAALEVAQELGARELRVFSDSELLVRQITGQYKVKNEGLRPLHQEAAAAASGFKIFSISHIRREANSEADGLVNSALDEGLLAGL